MSDLKRNESNKINQLLEVFPVVLILGVRQCGKTSLAKAVRPDWKYFDLENSKDREFIEQDFDFFFSEYPTNIIIDEAQELPSLFKNIRGVIDGDRKKNNRFILTGSSSPELVSLVSDSLAGRVGIVELGTLKVNEQIESPIPDFYRLFDQKIELNSSVKLLKEINTDKKIDMISFFLKGGYPQPIAFENQDSYELWMQNYFDTYINTDVRKLFPKLNLIRYQRFIQMLSEISGTVINRAQLGRSLDINEVSIKDYLEIADHTFFWRNIPSFERSKSKSLIKTPKGLIRDSGLNNFLADISNREELIRSPKVGHYFESFVMEEIIKGISVVSNKKIEYSYYRTKNGVEVDLILTGRFGILPIEIKFSTGTNKGQIKSLLYFMNQENIPLGIVVNNSSEVKMISENVIQIPCKLI